MRIHQILTAYKHTQCNEPSFPTALPSGKKKKKSHRTLDDSLKKRHKTNSVPRHHCKYINTERNAKQNQGISVHAPSPFKSKGAHGQTNTAYFCSISSCPPVTHCQFIQLQPPSASLHIPRCYESNNCPFGDGGWGRQ